MLPVLISTRGLLLLVEGLVAVRIQMGEVVTQRKRRIPVPIPHLVVIQEAMALTAMLPWLMDVVTPPLTAVAAAKDVLQGRFTGVMDPRLTRVLPVLLRLPGLVPT